MIGVSSCHNGCWMLWLSLLGDRTVTLELLPEKCQHGVHPHLLIEYLSYSPALQMTHSSWQREKITRVCVTHAPPLQSVCTHSSHVWNSVLVGPCASPSNPKSLGLLHFSKSEPKMFSLASHRVAFSGQSTGSRFPRQVWRKWQRAQQPPCQGSRVGETGEDLMRHIYRDTGDRHSPEGGPRLDRRGACLSSTPNGRSKFQDTPRTP